jgi:hypothetical protein
MTNYLNAKELKEQASIVDLLTRLGYHPQKQSEKEQYYSSILRLDDRTPSFCVDDRLGAWYDHGTGTGGNIIDFGLQYWKELSFTDVVDKINQTLTGTLSPAIPGRPRLSRVRKPVRIPHYLIEAIKPLGENSAITSYLKGRGIFEIGKDLLHEVYYVVKDQKGGQKHFFSAGWQNENGSWEVRNKYFKGCLGLKGITFIQGNPKNVAVFDGFFNYLSWRAENEGADQSILVLNTLSLLNAGIAKAREFSSIDIYFDRDATGHIASKTLKNALSYASDRSAVYHGFNDYNDKLAAIMKDRYPVASFAQDFRSGYSV